MPGEAVTQADVSESAGMQLAIPAICNREGRAKHLSAHVQSGDAAQERNEAPSQVLSTVSRRNFEDQQLCNAGERVYAGRADCPMPSVSLNTISKRALQFSMLADAIAGSDDATLGELAMQLHAQQCETDDEAAEAAGVLA